MIMEIAKVSLIQVLIQVIMIHGLQMREVLMTILLPLVESDMMIHGQLKVVVDLMIHGQLKVVMVDLRILGQLKVVVDLTIHGQLKVVVDLMIHGHNKVVVDLTTLGPQEVEMIGLTPFQVEEVWIQDLDFRMTSTINGAQLPPTLVGQVSVVERRKMSVLIILGSLVFVQQVDTDVKDRKIKDLEMPVEITSWMTQ